MKTIRMIFLVVCVYFASSCTDSITEDIDNNKTISPKEIKPSINKENIYIDQTDHISMLMKFVWLDKSSNKYILSLPENEAIELGFTKEEYHNIENYVKILNSINVSHK